MDVAATALGIPGYTFADLHEPERLASLYERFCAEVEATDPVFWRDWDAYRRAPDAPRPPLEVSRLLIGMAPHLSRFIKRLFDTDAPAAAIAASTRAQDDLFRFKVDFVRRRALPLLKGGARVASTPEDDAIVEGLILGAATNDRELAIARAGCALLDREKTVSPQFPVPPPPLVGDSSSDGGPVRPASAKAAAVRRSFSEGGSADGAKAGSSESEALKRWCAARVHDPAYRGWVIFRFPESLDYFHLVDVRHPEP